MTQLPWHLAYPASLLAVCCFATTAFSPAVRAEARPDGERPVADHVIAQRIPVTTTVTASIIYVDPQRGNDRRSMGSQQAPLRTITRALAIATPGTIIKLANGTYSEATGEVFPLQLQPGVILQGNPQNQGQGVSIRGGGYFISRTDARQNVAILAAEGAQLEGVTLTNPNTRGYGLWVENTSLTVINNTFTNNLHDGISITGASHPIVQNNFFRNNGANGMTVYGTSRAEIQENRFENTGFGLNINQDAQPRLRGNQILNNRDGVIVQGNARPILRGNLIQGNQRSGLAAVGNAQPDLGTASDPGANIFRDNGEHAIHVKASSQIVPAHGNTVKTQHTTGRIDWRGTVQVNQTAPSNLTSRTAPLLAPNRTNPSQNSALGAANRTRPRLNEARPHNSQTWVAPDGVEIPVIQPRATPSSNSASPSLNIGSSSGQNTTSIPSPPSPPLGVPDLPIPLGRTELPTVAVEQTPWAQSATTT
ncbi:MAG: DUF1565 domain-containing protein, partial [Cyanobacteria bacterium P01_H01_bin.121]